MEILQRPVTGAELFNRKELLNDLMTTRKNFALVGLRKAGKELAHQKRLSISKLIADAVRKYLFELEGAVCVKRTGRQDNSDNKCKR